MSRQATAQRPAASVSSAAPRAESTGQRMAELHGLMCNLLKLHRDLLDTVHAKLTAMRRSDAEAIQRCVRAEGECIREIQRQEGVRQCVAQHLGKALGLAHEESRKVPLAVLIERMPGGWSTRLSDIGQELGGVLESLQELNRRARTMATAMQGWHKSILEDTRTAFGAGAVYGRGGQAQAVPQAQVIDTHY